MTPSPHCAGAHGWRGGARSMLAGRRLGLQSRPGSGTPPQQPRLKPRCQTLCAAPSASPAARPPRAGPRRSARPPRPAQAHWEAPQVLPVSAAASKTTVASFVFAGTHCVDSPHGPSPPRRPYPSGASAHNICSVTKSGACASTDGNVETDMFGTFDPRTAPSADWRRAAPAHARGVKRCERGGLGTPISMLRARL